ncbi:MAG: hypothetical protein ACFFAH_14965 [Promethearchaeota archaeon]
MREINFITIGDRNYFPFIHFSIKQVLKFYPTSKLFIYDWGFTPFQKKKITTYPNTILIDWTDKLDREKKYNNIRKTYNRYDPIKVPKKKEYLLNQKPICILDCAKRVKENLIFFDGDTILINPIDEIFEDNYDIGLTINAEFAFEHKNISKGLSSWKYGVNSGVIFFKLNSIPMQRFIQEWINEIKTYYIRVLREQTSLFNLIRKRNREILFKDYNVGIIKLADLEYRIKTFPISIYNYTCIGESYDDKRVKFLHLITMKHYNPNLNKSIIIRDFIREIKIRYAFFPILKLVSTILSPKIRKNIREILNSFLIFKLLVRPYNFNIIKLILSSTISNIRKKIKKQES